MPGIAIVVNSFPKLSESFIYNKVRFLSENGYSVTVIVHNQNNDSTAFKGNELPKVQVTLTPAARPSYFRFLNLLVAFFIHPVEFIQVFQFLKTSESSVRNKLRLLLLYLPFYQKFDIIHFAFSGLALVYLPLIPLLRKKAKTFTSCRGHAEQIRPLAEPKRKEYLRQLFSQIDRVHCVSEDILKTCEKYGLEQVKAFVNRPAIETSVFQTQHGQPENHSSVIKIASVGRLHWKKGHEFLLIAIKLLLDKGIEALLHIAGDGPEREKIIFLIHHLRLENRVVLLGSQSREQIRDLLSQSDIYAHSSLSEGISNAVMEAMAMELPVVSTDVGGMSELISDGLDGLLVPALNPELMAAKLEILCQDGEMRKRFGRNARDKILKDFTMERQSSVFLSEYEKVLNLKS